MTVVREFDEEREKQASLMQHLLQEAQYVLIFNFPSFFPASVRRQSLSVAVPTVRLQSWVTCGAWLVVSWSKGQRSSTSY